jgi:CheY-like chemotaxis protein
MQIGPGSGDTTTRCTHGGPAARRAPPTPAAAIIAADGARLAPSRAVKRVMIVDDDADIRCGIAYALELEGYEVVQARDGREALQKLRHALRPAAIVLDLMMPGMNGWQFREEQRRDPELAKIPVIVTTARGGSDGTIQADAFVSKPFSLEILFEAIARCAA